MEHALRQTWIEEVDAPAPRPRVAADWPLMADIVSHRAGWPEHLIHWRRAEEREDPGPTSSKR